MKTFDFTDMLLKLCHRNRSAPDRVLFLTEDGDVYEPSSFVYDKDNRANVVKLSLVE